MYNPRSMTIDSFKEDVKDIPGIVFEDVGSQLRVHVHEDVIELSDHDHAHGLADQIRELAKKHELKLEYGEGDFLQFKEKRL